MVQLIFDKTGKENEDLNEWRELNLRWFQFGAFCPLFRSHGQFPYREIYNLAPENHPVYKSLVDYDQTTLPPDAIYLFIGGYGLP